MPEYALEETEQVSLCEALDRILNKGAVVNGELTISVANIDLIYMSLQLVLTSIETAREAFPSSELVWARKAARQTGSGPLR